MLIAEETMEKDRLKITFGGVMVKERIKSLNSQ